MSKAELAAWLRRRVRERTPTAVVRFGDAEGRLLTCDPEDMLRELESESGLSLSLADVIEVRALVDWAFDEADVLGIVTERLSDAHQKLMGKLAALYAERVAKGRPPAAFAHNMLGHHVVDELPELLAGRRAGVISCRDLGPVLEREWGLEEVNVYQVPSQYAMRDVDGAYEAAMHEVPIWPDAHAHVRAELTVRERGEVFLVGAGLFGKDLCIRVREQGGIALDMGSALDRLAGKLTRGPVRRVLALYAEGIPVSQIATTLERLFDVEVEHERVREAIANAALEHVEPWRARPLRPAYPTVCFDSLQAEVGDDRAFERRTCHLALGVAPDGYRDRLGIWWQGGEDVAFWRSVLQDLHRRGVRDLSILCGDAEREPLSQAARSVFPRAAVRTHAAPIESCAAIRKAIERHGRFTDEPAATTLVYLAFNRAESR
jgi:Transposase, Mutator family/GT-D fold-like domain